MNEILNNEKNRNNIKQAQKAIGYHSVSIYDFAERGLILLLLLDIITAIEKEKSVFEIEMIFTHHGGDLRTSTTNAHLKR